MRIATTAEAETRATAALLVIIRAVSEFGRSIVKLAGGPAGKITCYTEVPYVDDTQTPPLALRPDGLLVVAGRGGKTWRCFVEVKVGSNDIDPGQVGKYLQLARHAEVDALITISNEAIVRSLDLPKQQMKDRCLVHLSWDRLLSEARRLRGQGGVEDTDQQWMLDEWIQYVSDPMSKIIDPPSLGQHFSDVLTAAKEGNLSGSAVAVRDVCTHWDEFLSKAADRLRADLGVDVTPVMSNAEKQDNSLRVSNLCGIVLSESRLAGSLRIKNAASEVSVDVILSARAVRFGIDLKAPTEGKQLTRLKWLTKQLDKAPPAALLHVYWDQRKLQSHARVSELESELRCLLRDSHGQLIAADVMPKAFALEWTQDLLRAKGRNNAPVLDGIMGDLEAFYRNVVEGIVGFVPRAPKLPLAEAAEAGTVAATAPNTNIDAPAESGEIAIAHVAVGAATPEPAAAPSIDLPPQAAAINE
jgi:hypothetical protein